MNIKANPIGKKAKVPRGKKENARLKIVNTIDSTKKTFLIIIVLNTRS